MNSPITVLLVSVCITTFASIVDADEPRIAYMDNGQSYVFKADDRPILKYNHAVIQPPEGIDSVYARSGHIHPLYTPQGKVVTDDFSDDHAHQHGLFNAFVKAKVEGETLDFWNQHRKNANVKFLSSTPTKKKSTLITHQEHYRIRDNQPIFRETWKLTPSVQAGCFVVDLSIEIKNITDKKITIQKNHYGSLGLRGSGKWRDAEKSQFGFTTASGKHRKNGNQSREEWVCMHGKIDGESCGVVIVGRPTNFRHPQPARLHPNMPYFSFAPMSLGAFDIEPDETFRSQFRIITFDGKFNRDTIAQLARFED